MRSCGVNQKASQEMATAARANYRLGTLYALATAGLMAVQSPFSSLAAKSLSAPLFVCFTQIALLTSVPLLICRPDSRREFFAVLFDFRNIGKLATLFLIGSVGLLLYNVGLSGANPIITAGIMNLSPFWAALVAYVVCRKAIPTSPLVFGGCFVVAFIGAMIIAFSQFDLTDTNMTLSGFSLSEILRSRWIYAIPMPIFFALSGTLIFKWFPDTDESAVIAANFLVSTVILIPTTLIIAKLGHTPPMNDRPEMAILLLLVGTLASSAAGRVFYQVALSATRNDNGFVTMFLLIVPGIASLICYPLSWWIPELRVVSNPMFFIGLSLVTIPLAVFSLKSSSGGAIVRLDAPTTSRDDGPVASAAILP
jgi:drug/metabolite transporter (DMT)-like permease